MSRCIARRLAPAAAVLCLLIAAAGCGSSSSSDDSSSTPSAGTTASAGLPASIRSSGVLQIASDIPFPPYEYNEGGKVVGFEVDLANAMAKEVGVSVRFVQLPFDSIIPALQANKYPVAMSAISDTKEREQVVDFVDYSVDNEGILVPKGNPKHITGASSLCGLKVAVVRGTINARNAVIYSKRCVKEGHPAIQLATYQGDGVAQLTVRSGKSDAATSDAAALEYVAKTVDGGNAFSVVTYDDPQNPHMPVGVAMARGQDALRTAIKGALDKVLASGEYSQILAKYGLQSLALRGVTVNAAVN